MFELKKVKYMASLSHETHCYSADLYLHGRKVAEVSNAGHGGCDDVYYVNKLMAEYVAEELAKMDLPPTTDREKAELIRARIRKYADLGDSSYDHSQCNTPDSELLADPFLSALLTDKFFRADLEHICCDLVNDWLAAKELKKLLSKRVIWTKRNDPGLYQTQTAKNARVRDAWVSQVADDVDIDIVLNREPFDYALKVFKERTQ
jgi:hypothetical protein